MTWGLPQDRCHAVLDSPVGPLTVLAAHGALLGLWMERHKRPEWLGLGPRTDRAFVVVERQLGDYFAGERTEFDLPVNPPGSSFERSVWALVQAIPYGVTRTYGDLAHELGDPHAAQAVGGANGRNPVSIIIPCHRVVGADGSLTGYAGGLEVKRHLLELEARCAHPPDRLF